MIQEDYARKDRETFVTSSSVVGLHLARMILENVEVGRTNCLLLKFEGIKKNKRVDENGRECQHQASFAVLFITMYLRTGESCGCLKRVEEKTENLGKKWEIMGEHLMEEEWDWS